MKCETLWLELKSLAVFLCIIRFEGTKIGKVITWSWNSIYKLVHMCATSVEFLQKTDKSRHWNLTNHPQKKICSNLEHSIVKFLLAALPPHTSTLCSRLPLNFSTYWLLSSPHFLFTLLLYLMNMHANRLIAVWSVMLLLLSFNAEYLLSNVCLVFSHPFSSSSPMSVLITLALPNKRMTQSTTLLLQLL